MEGGERGGKDDVEAELRADETGERRLGDGGGAL